jgi:hypothetical protein
MQVKLTKISVSDTEILNTCRAKCVHVLAGITSVKVTEWTPIILLYVNDTPVGTICNW